MLSEAGGTARRTVTFSDTTGAPSGFWWSPRSQALVVTLADTDGTESYWLVDVASASSSRLGSGYRSAALGQPVAVPPAWSPDGATIALAAADGSGNASLDLSSATASSTLTAIGPAVDARSGLQETVSWAPDSAHLLADLSGETLLSDAAGQRVLDVTSASWQPLVSVAWRDDSGLVAYVDQWSYLHVVHMDGSADTTTALWSWMVPSWAGATLLLSDSSDLFTVLAGQNQPTQVQPPVPFSIDPVVTADGWVLLSDTPPPDQQPTLVLRNVITDTSVAIPTVRSDELFVAWVS